MVIPNGPIPLPPISISSSSLSLTHGKKYVYILVATGKYKSFSERGLIVSKKAFNTHEKAEAFKPVFRSLCVCDKNGSLFSTLDDTDELEILVRKLELK